MLVNVFLWLVQMMLVFVLFFGNHVHILYNVDHHKNVLIQIISIFVFQYQLVTFLEIKSKKWKKGGSQPNQFESRIFIFVNDEQSIYISDMKNHRVMEWRKDAPEGEIIIGGNRPEQRSDQLREPDELEENLYASDALNNRILLWKD